MNCHGAAATLGQRTEGADVLDGALDLVSDFGRLKIVPAHYPALVLHPSAQLRRHRAAWQGRM